MYMCSIGEQALWSYSQAVITSTNRGGVYWPWFKTPSFCGFDAKFFIVCQRERQKMGRFLGPIFTINIVVMLKPVTWLLPLFFYGSARFFLAWSFFFGLCDICRLTPRRSDFCRSDFCRSRHLPVATFAGRDICRSRHLPVATFAGRDICRSRHLPVATLDTTQHNIRQLEPWSKCRDRQKSDRQKSDRRGVDRHLVDHLFFGRSAPSLQLLLIARLTSVKFGRGGIF